MSRVPILIPVPIPPGFPACLDDTLQAGDSPRVRPGLLRDLSPSLPSAVLGVSPLGTGDAARPLCTGPQQFQQDRGELKQW